MTAWTDYQLDALSGATDIRLKSRKDNGSLTPAAIVWVVALDDNIYVRADGGQDVTWFERAQLKHRGRITGGGIEEDVVFEEPDGSLTAAINGAYELKYGRFGDQYVDAIVSPEAESATFRLVLEDEEE